MRRRCRQPPYLHGPIPLRVHEWRKALWHGVIEKVDLRQKLAERASKNIGKLMPCRLAMSARNLINIVKEACLC